MVSALVPLRRELVVTTPFSHRPRFTSAISTRGIEELLRGFSQCLSELSSGVSHFTCSQLALHKSWPLPSPRTYTTMDTSSAPQTVSITTIITTNHNGRATDFRDSHRSRKPYKLRRNRHKLQLLHHHHQCKRQSRAHSLRPSTT